MAARNFVFLRAALPTQDGQAIFDTQVVNALRNLGCEVREISLQKNRKWQSVVEGAKRLTSPNFFTFSRPYNEIKKLNKNDEIIISHEALSLVLDDLPKDQPIYLIMHNLPSAFKNHGDPSVLDLLRHIALRHEKVIFQQPNILPVLLSQRELKIVAARSTSNLPKLLQPGAPPAATESTSAANNVDLVVSGSFDWKVKRTDANWLRDEILAKIAYDPKWMGKAYADQLFDGHFPKVVPPNKLPDDGKIRIGIVPDRFVTGFKLKTIWYIANNCLLAAPVNLLEEFEGLPHAQDFIRSFENSAELEEIMRDTLSINIEQFSEFKSAVLDRFNWKTQTANAFDIEFKK